MEWNLDDTKQACRKEVFEQGIETIVSDTLQILLYKIIKSFSNLTNS